MAHGLRTLTAVLVVAGAVATACSSDASKATSTRSSETPASTAVGDTTRGATVAVVATSKPTLLTIGRTEELTRLDPQWDSGVWVSMLFEGNVTESLIERGPQGELMPRLAASYELMNNNTTWRFHLRQGVKFQNDEPFNADAVVFSFQRLVNKESANAPYFTGFKSVQKVDDMTVDVNLDFPNPDYP